MLTDLQQALSPRDFEKFLRQSLDSIAAYKTRLDDDIAASDHRQAQRTAHALRGTSAQIGADEVASIAIWIEEQSPNIDAVQDAMPRLEDSIARVRDSVLELVPEEDPLG
jgi:HPt (histidine-containing phosphotransfer) domain-containing protein